MFIDEAVDLREDLPERLQRDFGQHQALKSFLDPVFYLNDVVKPHVLDRDVAVCMFQFLRQRHHILSFTQAEPIISAQSHNDPGDLRISLRQRLPVDAFQRII